MTSRYAPAYRCLNGPMVGQFIEAPHAMPIGKAMAVGWGTAKGPVSFAVYILTTLPSEEDPPRQGLMYVRSWATPAQAEAHVRQLDLVTSVARAAAEDDPDGSSSGGDAPVRT